MRYSSRIIEQAVESFSKFPGVGKKSALRMVLHLAKLDKLSAKDIINPLESLINELHECSECHNFSDETICEICKNKRRDQSIICVVESAKDVMKIEDTGQYNGVYHVLSGTIKPIEGIGPEDINIASLVRRVEKDEISEIIMALNPTIDGDTTVYYISKLLGSSVMISTIARGIAFGGELEYVDDITLGRSIMARVEYELD